MQNNIFDLEMGKVEKNPSKLIDSICLIATKLKISEQYRHLRQN